MRLSMLNNFLNSNFFKKKHLVLFFLIFTITRLIIFNIFEIRVNPPNYGYHLLDIELLKNDLIQSLIFLHSQPPLFNLYQGIFLKIFDTQSQIAISFNIMQSFFSLVIIYISYLISDFFKLSLNQKSLLLLILIINPTIIFYENLFSYHLLISLLFILLSYYLFKYFYEKNKKYEILIYLIISLLCLTWGLFQPILIIIFYICFRFIDRLFSKKIFILTFICLLFASTSHIKNKIIFGSFSSSSWTGHGFSTVFINDWRNYCGEPLIDQNFYQKKYEEKFKKKFTHPSLIGDKAKYNNIGLIYKSPICFSRTLDKIKQQPFDYIESRTLAFLASHGKFAFDFVYPNPSGWLKYYGSIKNLYKNENIKLFRQVCVFTLNIFIYATMVYLIFFSNYSLDLKISIFFIGLAYMYLFSISFLFSCCEQERMLFTGYIKEILFIIYLIKHSSNLFKFS
tara:strand:+ start:296 stop:1654 length:1359 start_codon:yes stop_codon:yes gene_type:complete